MKKLLVLGVGNILLMDEGIGVKAVHELLKEDWPDTVEFLDGGTFTQDIFYVFQEYENILVLDVVKGGEKPGTVYRFTDEELIKDENQTMSLHDIDMMDSLKMAEMLGNKPKMDILGIQPETINWGTDLTETLQKVYSGYLVEARKDIRKILAR